MATLKDLTGQRFGRLTVVSQHSGRSRYGEVCWECRCDCGAGTIVTGSHLRRSHTTSCGCAQREGAAVRMAAMRRGERVEEWAYSTVHHMLARSRGAACDHSCTDCDRPAHEWSYVGGCPNELTDERGQVYSPNLDAYVPRCRPCHRAADRRTYNRTCEECGTAFAAATPDALYCSARCKRRVDYRREDRDRRNELWRAWDRRRKAERVQAALRETA